MMNRSEFIEFMKRMEAADMWDAAEPEDWSKACEYAGINYSDYDDPDMMWRDLCKVLDEEQ